jgi:hypothetical protein
MDLDPWSSKPCPKIARHHPVGAPVFVASHVPTQVFSCLPPGCDDESRRTPKLLTKLKANEARKLLDIPGASLDGTSEPRSRRRVRYGYIAIGNDHGPSQPPARGLSLHPDRSRSALTAECECSYSITEVPGEQFCVGLYRSTPKARGGAVGMIHNLYSRASAGRLGPIV